MTTSGSEVNDYSGIHALNAVGEKYTRLGKKVYLRHLNAFSEKLLAKAEHLGVHFNRGHAESEEFPAVADQATSEAEGKQGEGIEEDGGISSQTPLEALSDSQRESSGTLVQVTVDSEVVGHRPAVVSSK